MDDWISYEYQSGMTRADRLFIEGVERVLIDIPGCPLILTTDSPYPRQGDNNWWSFVVQVDRQDTYHEEMSSCNRIIQLHAAFEFGWITVLIIELSQLTALMTHVLQIPLWASIATPTPIPTPTLTPTPTVEAQPTAVISPEHAEPINDIFQP